MSDENRQTPDWPRPLNWAETLLVCVIVAIIGLAVASIGHYAGLWEKSEKDDTVLKQEMINIRRTVRILERQISDIQAKDKETP